MMTLTANGFVDHFERSLRQDGLAGSRVLPDEQSFSSGGGDAEGQFGGGDELVFEHLHRAVQPAAQAVRASVQRALQVADRGRQRQRLSADGVRLCAFESGAGEAAARRSRRCVAIAWSSWPEYLKRPGTTSALAAGGPVAGRNRIPLDSAAGRRELEAVLEARRAGGDGADYKRIRRGWCLGGEALKQELLAQVSEKTGQWHYGEAVRESAEAKAERMVAAELARRKWDETTLAARRKGDAGKVVVAQRLRRETTVTLAWIAERLRMGTRTYLAHLLYWKRRNEK